MKNVNFILNLTYLDEINIKDYNSSYNKLNLNYIYEDNILEDFKYNQEKTRDCKAINNEQKDYCGIYKIIPNTKEKEYINEEDILKLVIEKRNSQKNSSYFIKSNLKDNSIFFEINQMTNNNQFLSYSNKKNLTTNNTANPEYNYRNKYDKSLKEKINKISNDTLNTKISEIIDSSDLVNSNTRFINNLSVMNNYNSTRYKENNSYNQNEDLKRKNSSDYFEYTNSKKNCGIIDKKDYCLFSNSDTNNKDFFIKRFPDEKNGIIENFDYLIENNIINLKYNNQTINLPEKKEYFLENENNLKFFENNIIENIYSKINENQKNISNSFIIYGPEKSGKSSFLRGGNLLNKSGFMINLIKNIYNIFMKNTKDNDEILYLKYGSFLLIKNDLINLTKIDKKKSYHDEIYVESFNTKDYVNKNDFKFNEYDKNKKLGILNIKHIKKIEEIENSIYDSIMSRKDELKNYNQDITDESFNYTTFYHFSIELKDCNNNLIVDKLRNKKNKFSNKITKILNGCNGNDIFLQFDFFEVNNKDFNNSNNCFDEIKKRIEMIFDRKILIKSFPSLERILYKNHKESDYVYFILNLMNYKNKNLSEDSVKLNDNDNIIETYGNKYIENNLKIEKFCYLRNSLNALKLNLYFKKISNRKDLLLDNHDFINIEETCDECIKLQNEISKSRKMNFIFEEEVKKIQNEMEYLESSLNNLKKMKVNFPENENNSRYSDYSNKNEITTISNINIPNSINKNENISSINKKNAKLNSNLNNFTDLEKLYQKINLNSNKLEKHLNTIYKILNESKIDISSIKTICQKCKIKKNKF